MYWGSPPVTPQETIAMLRVLSQTSRHLREFALPRLWSIVHVDTAAELGRLGEVLKASPSIAPHIRHFSFSWTMGMDTSSCRNISQDEGTLIDLAFRDRRAIWIKLRQEVNEWADEEGLSEEEKVERWNKRDDVEGSEPGWPVMREGARFPTFDVGTYDGGVGPDGNGADRLIESADTLERYLLEVVSKLTSIETFRWATRGFTMPQAIFEVLKELRGLKVLHFELPSARALVPSSIPFWHLTSSLTDLSIGIDCSYFLEDFDGELAKNFRATIVLLLEKEFRGSELSSMPTTLEAEVQEQHLVIAARTIISAAQAGHLRRLSYSVRSPQVPSWQSPLVATFAIRQFLPSWIGIENWDVPKEDQNSWTCAAYTLRPILAHASLHFGQTVTGATADRHLAQEDVQSLESRFEADSVPKLLPRDNSLKLTEEGRQPIELYLPWLKEAELARQVADAWNEVVDRGEADVVKCWCSMCSDEPSPEREPEITNDLLDCASSMKVPECFIA